LVEGDTLWVATSDSGLMRSVDNGQNWQFIQNNLDWWAHVAWAVMRDSATSTLFVGTPNGLFYSTDNGSTWIQPTPPLPYTTWKSGAGVSSFLTLQDGSIVASVTRGVIRSTDNGQTWRTVFYDSISGATSFALNQESNTVFAGMNGGNTRIIRSTDNGKTWQVSADGINYSSVQCLASSATGTIYAGTGNYYWQGDGLYESTNNGMSWTRVQGIPSAYRDVSSILVVKPNLIFVGFDGGDPAESGVFRYDGSSWTQISTTAFSYVFSLAAQGNNLLVGTPDGLYRVSNVLTAVHEPAPTVPLTFALSQNYPNPFNPTTSIMYAVTSRMYTTLTVYNVLGEKVATLVDGEKAPGSYTATFDGSKLPSGIYLYRLQAGSFTQTRRMLLIK